MSLAVSALAALAHPSRLEAFRLLVRASNGGASTAGGATEGVPAGEIAAELGIAPPTLSFHLGQLVQAGLVASHRESRSVLYSLRAHGIRDLIGFLTEDCCQGRPELCSPAGAGATGCKECES